MTEDVKLKSLTFKSGPDANMVSSICCTLTDGKSSGVIEKANLNHGKRETIEFDASKTIKSVSASDDAWGCLWRIRFMDKDGK